MTDRDLTCYHINQTTLAESRRRAAELQERLHQQGAALLRRLGDEMAASDRPCAACGCQGAGFAVFDLEGDAVQARPLCVFCAAEAAPSPTHLELLTR